MPAKTALELQLAKYENAIEEFKSMDTELRRQPLTARVADMIRLNLETIQAMTRSVELVRARIDAMQPAPKPDYAQAK